MTEFKSLIDYELSINQLNVDDPHENEVTTKVIATNDKMDIEGKYDVDTVKNEIPNNDIKEEMFDGDINLKVIGSYYRQRSADIKMKNYNIETSLIFVCGNLSVICYSR